MQPLLVGRTPDEAILFPRLVNINELSNDEFDICKVANNTLERILLGVTTLLGAISQKIRGLRVRGAWLETEATRDAQN